MKNIRAMSSSSIKKDGGEEARGRKSDVLLTKICIAPQTC